MWPVLSIFLFIHIRNVFAVKFPIQIRTPHLNSPNLTPRAISSVPVLNTHNAEYISNITLGGRTIPVLLDTGSSDLWVVGDVPNAKDLGVSTELAYAVGEAAGTIHTADLQFDGYTVSDQAFLLVQNASSFSTNIAAQGFNGLIGLGPNTGSVIQDKLDDDAGDGVLSRIFSQNSTSANYLTILLDRIGGGNQSFTGQITISELVEEFSNITTMPKLTVDKVHRLTDADQHWQVYTDAYGIIGPDGNSIDAESIVPKAPDNQMVVIFDSGFSLSQVPRAMSDAIYGRVQGAEYNEASEVWLVPCSQQINLAFKFGGNTYPIHPLDVSSSDYGMMFSNGNPACVGTFQPITSAFSLLGEYDIILGMSFMRNVYTLLDYGNFIKDSSVDRDDPFVQILSVTDNTTAHNDFVEVRMDGVDSTGSSQYALLPTDQMQHSPVSAAEKKKQYEEMILSRWPYIFVGCFAFVLIVVGLIIWRCCVRRRRQREAKSAQIMGSKGNSGSPKSLEDGSETTSMHIMGTLHDLDEDPYAAHSPKKY